jgi:hypothetical protein
LECYVPTDGTRAANMGTGDFGTSPIFVQLSDKALLVSTLLVGVSERKAQWRIKKLCADPVRVVRSGAGRFERVLPQSLHRPDPNVLRSRWTRCVYGVSF